MNRNRWMKLAAVAMIACVATVFAADPVPVKGNPNTKVFHKASCRYYNAEGSSKEFATEAEAVKAGYTPCKQCYKSKEKAQESTTSSSRSE